MRFNLLKGIPNLNYHLSICELAGSAGLCLLSLALVGCSGRKELPYEKFGTLKADKKDKKHGSLMYYYTSSKEEIVQRIEYLNFNIESLLFIEYNGVKFSPVLSHFEGFDQLGNRAMFLVSFIGLMGGFLIN